MVSSLLKYISIAYTAGVLYAKILNIHKNRIHYLFLIPYSIVSAFVFIFANWLDEQIALQVFLVIAILLLNTFYIMNHDIRTNVSIITSTIAIVMSYIVYIISTILMSPIVLLVFQNEIPIEYYDFMNSISIILICILQYVICFSIFKIKRLRNGIPYLVKNQDHEIGLFVCILALIIVSLFSMRGADSANLLMFSVLILILGMILLIWWRKRVTEHYLKKTRERQYQAFIQEIEEKNVQIQKLKEDNERLSKIIHKDNKLIPATELLVREYMQSGSNVEQGQEILARLNALYQDRKGILSTSECFIQLPNQTGILSLDATLNYMSKRAQVKNIQFSVSLYKSMSDFLKEISEEDFNTLLCDLIENAILSANKASTKHVKVNFGYYSCYFIEILDSGEPFSPEVLNQFGRIPITTRKETGGSGIGLVTILHILNNYKASLKIQTKNIEKPFTKKIIISFDEKNQIEIPKHN
jgi:signal transduction histidine kinase